ncbi:MAG TPA: hypothetical protein VHU77_10100 [Candidatus Limnocylindria bacterium]|jgi:hypothetical protein|nr:hypothetical protein [Candidatus Limnocylindria bacterium]
MPPFSVIALIGAALVLVGLAGIRLSGADSRLARRLAAARQLSVGDLLGAETLPQRPVRVSGRIRCANPIVTARDDRLVAYHRDVQVKPPGRAWRSIERIRETRGFELWDHHGSLALDPGQAAEPLVVIPHVWRGSATELTTEPHRAAVARLGGADAAWPARSVTRMLSVVERLLVLADVERDSNGTVTLVAPPGGFVISGLELDAAMRLLAGRRRGVMLAGYGLLAIGAIVLVAAVMGLAIGS